MRVPRREEGEISRLGTEESSVPPSVSWFRQPASRRPATHSYRMATRKIVRVYVCMLLVGLGFLALGVVDLATAVQSSSSQGVNYAYGCFAILAGIALTSFGGLLLRFQSSLTHIF